jgi:hypothetical protein
MKNLESGSNFLAFLGDLTATIRGNFGLTTASEEKLEAALKNYKQSKTISPDIASRTRKLLLIAITIQEELGKNISLNLERKKAIKKQILEAANKLKKASGEE